MTEIWTECRCIACVPCGFESSRLLFKVSGETINSGATIQVVCSRCKSLISWEIGTLKIDVVKQGVYNHKRNKVPFE